MTVQRSSVKDYPGSVGEHVECLTRIYIHTHDRSTVFCQGLPGWAGTRRNIHPLTLMRKKKKNLHRQQGSIGAHPLYGAVSQRELLRPS